MAFIKNKYTAFDPSVTINPILYDSYSYFPYTKKFTVKGDYQTNGKYAHSDEITHLTFDGTNAKIFKFALYGGDQLEEISFINETLAGWNSSYKFYWQPSDAASVKKINFTSVGATWNFDTNAELKDMPNVEEITVYNGWDKNLTCLSTHLTVASITAIINNLATVTGTKTLQFAVTSSVPAAVIQIAVDKGWTVS